jgi:FG-GAP repeat
MRRIAVVLLVLAGSAWPATNAIAVGAAASQPAPPRSLQADFNNDGADDLAIGAPFESVGTVRRAGAVNVLYGTADGLSGLNSQVFHQNSPDVDSSAEEDDDFGFALAAGDFNDDGFADLAVGVPFEDAGATPDVGAVNVLYGSANGLGSGGGGGVPAGRLFTQLGSAPEPGDAFGFALTSGDYNGDGFTDLAAGAPLEDAFTTPNAGAVSVVFGSANGLTEAGGRLFTQVGSQPEAGDLFAADLAAGDFDDDGADDLAVAAPFEAAFTTAEAGAVSVLPGSPGGLTTTGARLFTQVGSAPEPGDAFGFALAAGDFDDDDAADLAVGAPGEDAFTTVDAGAVSVLPGSAGGLTATGGRLFTQVGSQPETGDGFGNALAAGDFDDDGADDLAAGAPLEDAFTTVDAGAVSVLPGSAGGLTATGGRLFTQAGSAPETEDFFGDALAAGDFDDDGFADLAAGAPLEDAFATANAGAVSVLDGSAGGVTSTGSQVLTQDTPGVESSAEPDDHFGAALATSTPATSAP